MICKVDAGGGGGNETKPWWPSSCIPPLAWWLFIEDKLSQWIIFIFLKIDSRDTLLGIFGPLVLLPKVPKKMYIFLRTSQWIILKMLKNKAFWNEFFFSALLILHFDNPIRAFLAGSQRNWKNHKSTHGAVKTN